MATKWSCQLLNKNLYIQKFKDLGLKSYQMRQVDQTWYKPKFEWKIEFNFSRQDANYSHYRHSSDHRWVDLLEDCHNNEWIFRKRREVWCNIYTTDSRLLDHILTEEKYSGAIVSVEYTSDMYLSELTEQVCGDAVTDIKFVKTVPEHRYQVYLGNFDWHDPTKITLTEYLTTNRDVYLFKGWFQEIIVRFGSIQPVTNASGHHITIGDGFNFFAKSTDDILLLHLMAPGKIRKIVKLMEKQK